MARYTDELKHQIMEEYETGTSIADIAKMTGKRYPAIRQAVNSKWYAELKAEVTTKETESVDSEDVVEEVVEDVVEDVVTEQEEPNDVPEVKEVPEEVVDNVTEDASNVGLPPEVDIETFESLGIVIDEEEEVDFDEVVTVSYTHLTLPTTPYV